MLAACLAFRNAAPYLREWLLFHLSVGFDRFYLYNNDSTDDYAESLRPFLGATTGGRQRFELIDWPGYIQQNAIYDDCLRRAEHDVEWLAFIDDDEFLSPQPGYSLPALLKEYKAYAGVAACWTIYGTSGRLYHESAPVISRFTRRAARPDQHVKCIVQPSLVKRALVGAISSKRRRASRLLTKTSRQPAGRLRPHRPPDTSA